MFSDPSCKQVDTANSPGGKSTRRCGRPGAHVSGARSELERRAVLRAEEAQERGEQLLGAVLPQHLARAFDTLAVYEASSI